MAEARQLASGSLAASSSAPPAPGFGRSATFDPTSSGISAPDPEATFAIGRYRAADWVHCIADESDGPYLCNNSASPEHCCRPRCSGESEPTRDLLRQDIVAAENGFQLTLRQRLHDPIVRADHRLGGD
jgi:hypothetical protein